MHENYVRVEAQVHEFLTLALNGVNGQFCTLPLYPELPEYNKRYSYAIQFHKVTRLLAG
jgi:hypothetical protein